MKAIAYQNGSRVVVEGETLKDCAVNSKFKGTVTVYDVSGDDDIINRDTVKDADLNKYGCVEFRV